MPDFFDRLIARTASPDPALHRAAGVVRVRPRLPSLFERSDPAEPEPLDTPTMARLAEASAAPPADAAPAIRAAEPAAVSPIPPAASYVDRDRRPPRPPSPAVGDPPLIGVPPDFRLPAAPSTVVAAAVVPSTDRRDDARPPARVVERVGPLPVIPRAAAVPRPPANLPAPASGGQASRREPPRPAERSVQVRIGRIEVTAPPRPDAAASARPRPRREPALTLARYLGRDVAEQSGGQA
jgi:translation initiation factor IF-2